MGIANFAIPAAFNADGVYIDGVVPESPASGVLTSGMVIESVNGISTSNFTNYQKELSSLKIGETVALATDQGTFKIKTAENPNNSSKAYIGIRSTVNMEVDETVAKTYGEQIPWVWFYLQEIFKWIFLINLAVGTFNLLPLKAGFLILDGALMLEEALRYKLSDRHIKPIVNIISSFLGLIILVSIIVWLVRAVMIMTS